jgi:hypothetical protein
MEANLSLQCIGGCQRFNVHVVTNSLLNIFLSDPRIFLNSYLPFTALVQCTFLLYWPFVTGNLTTGVSISALVCCLCHLLHYSELLGVRPLCLSVGKD